MKKVDANFIQPESLSAKAKINYKTPDGRSQSFNANLRLKTDSAVWISIVPFLGIEVARVLVTPESLQVIDRFNKKYYEYDRDGLSNFVDYPIDFNLLQNALLGNPLYPMDKPKATINEGRYFLEDQFGNIMNRAWLNPASYDIEKMQLFDEAAQKRIDVEMTDFKKEKTFNFPSNRVINVKTPENYRIEVQMNRIKFDQPVEMPFNVSSKYDKVG